MTLPRIFASYNLIAQGAITNEDLTRAVSVALSEAREAVLQGGASTSLESPDTRLHYRLMTGERIVESLPWLYEMYRSTFCAMASRVYGQSMRVSPNVRNAINFNVVEGIGARYEWHVDSNPLTGVLYMTETSESTGGRLVFRGDEGGHADLLLPMRRGTLVLFDARYHPHAVEPLLTSEPRICAPMNFFVEGQEIQRPQELDEYLYGGGVDREGRNHSVTPEEAKSLAR
jgi:hypothetical protein